MTISSYPWIKLLVAIIAAIVVGIISNSWGWGIATFFIFMFIFIWVASWIFGGSIKGKVEVTEELDFLLGRLQLIGNKKNELPLNARGWCNSLGLFVQLKEKGNMTRLQAGDKYHSQIDAWLDFSPGADNTFSPPDSDSIFSRSFWKVKKYSPGDWEKLVDPTLDIAYWLGIHGGLHEKHADAFNRAIEIFKKEGYLELPQSN
jgi:hypothetical protein